MADNISEGMFRKVNRIRDGELQRKVKVTDKPGHKVDKDGKVVRMKASEKLARKRGQRRGAKKRMAKMPQSLRRRKKSLRIRARRKLDQKGSNKDE